MRCLALLLALPLFVPACGGGGDGSDRADACAALPLRHEAVASFDSSLPADDARLVFDDPVYVYMLGNLLDLSDGEEAVRLFGSQHELDAVEAWQSLPSDVREAIAPAAFDWTRERLLLVGGWIHADHHRLFVEEGAAVLRVLRLHPCVSAEEAEDRRAGSWGVRVFAVPAVESVRIVATEARHRMPEVRASGACARDPSAPSFSRTASVGDVIEEAGGKFRLFFEGYSAMTGNVFTATSSDGLRWSPSGWDEDFLCTFEGHGPYADHYGPTVRHEGAAYVMYYGDDSWAEPPTIRRSRSADAIAFAEEEVVLTLGELGAWDGAWVGSPEVVEHVGRQWLFYAAHGGGIRSAVGLAVSDDGGATFRRASPGPVLEGGPPGSWDELGVWAPEVLVIDGRFHLWFTTGSGANPWMPWRASIGHAVSDDGLVWTKDEWPVLVPARSWESAGISRPAVLRDGDGYRLWYTGIDRGEPSIGHARCSF